MITDGIMCLNLKGHFWALLNNCRGQDLIEYALLSGFIVCAVVTLSPEIADSFFSIMSKANSLLVLAGAS
jgi:Flp pilus assembly pilin Flp